MKKVRGTFNPIKDNWLNRHLISRLIAREVSSRYKGSFLGFFWSFFNPLVMLAIYTFVFGFVFEARWGEAPQSNFAIVMFAGMVCHGFVAESINLAPGLILKNQNYVKKIIFPLHSLGVVSVGSALFHFGVGLVILLLGELLVFHAVPWTWVYLPLILLPLITLCLGFTWLFASLGVYLRDISQLTGILATLLLFLAPILYPISSLPENLQPLLYLNPLTFLVMQFQSVLVFGKQPDFTALLGYFAGVSLFAELTYIWFQKTKSGFADVL